MDAIMANMELVEMKIRDVVYEPNSPIEYAYFPESGVISIVTPLQDGSAVEAVTVGREGFVGLPIVLQATLSSTRAFCQIPAKAWRIKSEDLSRHIADSPYLSRLLLRYAQTVFDLVAQTAACNRLHTIEERCARWLLILHDRTKGEDDSFTITQEFLAQMLGVRRGGVNLAAGILQKADTIIYVRGKITILNRQALEGISCECYSVVRHALAALEASE